MMKLYVGNLPEKVTEQLLRDAFEDYGKVAAVQIVRDRTSGQPWGYAFVMMSDRQEAQEALRAMNGRCFLGSTIRVEKSLRTRRGFVNPTMKSRKH
jgi:RNA recognition motif-containing protein